MNWKCIFEHKWINTTRKMLTFDESGKVIPCESPTVRCERCGEFKDIEREYLMAKLAAGGI